MRSYTGEYMDKHVIIFLVSVLSVYGLFLYDWRPDQSMYVVIITSRSGAQLCLPQVSSLESIGGAIVLTTSKGPAVFGLESFFAVSIAKADSSTGEEYCMAALGAHTHTPSSLDDSEILL